MAEPTATSPPHKPSAPSTSTPKPEIVPHHKQPEIVPQHKQPEIAPHKQPEIVPHRQQPQLQDMEPIAPYEPLSIRFPKLSALPTLKQASEKTIPLLTAFPLSTLKKPVLSDSSRGLTTFTVALSSLAAGVSLITPFALPLAQSQQILTLGAAVSSTGMVAGFALAHNFGIAIHLPYIC